MPPLLMRCNLSTRHSFHPFHGASSVHLLTLSVCMRICADHFAVSCILITLPVQDVLVATDVASKGLDFPEIQHVINYDMPDEIENYVHRIGRTGRCGKTGIATTFINKNQVSIGAGLVSR